MEQRLIDANTFVQEKRNMYCNDCNRRKGTKKNGKKGFIYQIGGVPCRACEVEEMLDYIEDAPTVDAVPVKHGHWEIVPNDKNTDSYYKMRCSVCGGTLWSIQSEELFCCKCGSKMDGADGERK